MDRLDAGLLVLALLGVVLVLAAPPEPQYSVDVETAGDDVPDEVRDYEALDGDARKRFRAELDGDTGTFAETPALENGYVRYQGTLYRVTVAAHESSLASVLVPLVGQALAVVGVAGLVGRRLWRRVA